jgi:chromate transporter
MDSGNAPMAAQTSKPPERARLGELALLFGRLGATSFGGPLAHIAMMEDEVVRRRRWLSREEFLDLIAATNMIPGPNSTEMAIHIGLRRAGMRGFAVAGACFILPAVVIVWALAWAYVRYGQLARTAGFLYGVKPVVIAIVLQAMWAFGRTALKSRSLAVVGLACVALAIAGVHELVVLGAGGVLALVARGSPRSTAALAFACAAPATVAAAAAQAFDVSRLFLVFLRIGSVLFGSGYVLLAFLRAELVERLGWLSEAQLLDAVAIGQVTPGPLFTTATFVGYVLGGHRGLLAATLGIFLPAFFFVAVSGPLVPRLRRSAAAAAFLDGVVVASLALMAQVTVVLTQAAIRDATTAVLAVASGVLLMRYRVNSTWLVLGGAVVGWGLS